MTEYLRLQAACCKPSTVNGYRTNLGHFHDYLRQIYTCQVICKKHIARLSKRNLQKYLTFLNSKKLTPYTRVNYLLSVKKYLAWEAEQGTIDESLLETLDRKYLPKVPEYLPKPLSHQNDRILQDRWRSDDSSYAKFFLLLRLTGLRIGELINLPNDCVVTNAHNEPFLKVPLGKMDNERLVPLNHEALDIITMLKAISPAGKYDTDPNRLVAIAGAVPFVYNQLRRKLIRTTGDIIDQGKPITLHRLRHTYATSLLTGGVSIVSLMKLLGHRRIEMTLRYAKVTPSHLRNEYLHAIANLEKGLIPPQQLQSLIHTHSIALHELIDRICAFLLKEASLDVRQRKNMAKRFARLKSDIEKIPLTQNFPISP